MTDTVCHICTYCEVIYDKDRAKHDQWCISPQVRMAQNRRARCNFETDGFAEAWRDTPEKRKCGKDHINYKARANG